MARFGKKPVLIPNGIEIKVTKENEVIVKGPKGTLNVFLADGIILNIEQKELSLVADETLSDEALHGLYRSLIENMITGVHKGFEKKLELIGTGYRAQIQGSTLDLKLGYSHPTSLQVPKALQVTIDKAGIVTVAGIDKQLVGEFAAQIRAKRPPEPYKGKGIRYVGEYVRKKAGKASKSK